jgi:hypothetical protein
LNTWKEKNEVFARIGDKVVVVDKHILGQNFKILTESLKEEKQVENARMDKVLEHITMCNAYVTNEGWIVAMMKKPFNVKFLTLI